MANNGKFFKHEPSSTSKNTIKKSHAPVSLPRDVTVDCGMGKREREGGRK